MPQIELSYKAEGTSNTVDIKTLSIILQRSQKTGTNLPSANNQPLKKIPIQFLNLSAENPFDWRHGNPSKDFNHVFT